MKIIFAKSNMVFNINPELKLKLDKIINPDNQLYMNKIFDYFTNNKMIEADGGLDKDLSSNLDLIKKNISEISSSSESNGNEN